jgi:hypothetical protein
LRSTKEFRNFAKKSSVRATPPHINFGREQAFSADFFYFEAQQGLAFPPNKGTARSNGGSEYFGCAEIARSTRKNRCEIRSISRASPRSAQDDARGRTAYISTAFLSIHKKSAEKSISADRFLSANFSLRTSENLPVLFSL